MPIARLMTRAWPLRYLKRLLNKLKGENVKPTLPVHNLRISMRAVLEHVIMSAEERRVSAERRVVYGTDEQRASNNDSDTCRLGAWPASGILDL